MNRIILALFSVFILTGCFADMSIKPHAGYPVCVKCILCNDDVQTLELMYAAAVGTEEYEPVEDATVVLFDISGDGKKEVARFKHEEGTRWTANYTPVGGSIYGLEVEVPGRDLISAQTVFPESFKVYGLLTYGERYMEATVVQGLLGIFDGDIANYHKYIDELHEMGKRDFSEVYPGALYRIECENDIRLMVRSDNYKYKVGIALDLGGLNDLTIFGGRLKSTEDEISRGYGPVYYPVDYNVYYPFVIADYPRDYDNGHGRLTLLYRKDHTKKDGDMEFYPSCEKFFRMLPVVIEKAPLIQQFQVNHSLMYNMTFYSITDELEQYILHTWRGESDDSTCTNILEKLYSGDETYTNIQNGYGVFAAWYKTAPIQEIEDQLLF